MKFAKAVFIGAGIWGIVVLLPLYWLVDITGRAYVAPAQHPEFFYGFFGVALVWQVAFLIIGTDPVRFRPLMIPAILEKLGYVATLTVLYAKDRIAPVDLQALWPDLGLGLLFIAAFIVTPRRSVAAASQ